MRKLLVVTIDTEVDKASDWKVSAEETYGSVLFGIPELLQPIFQSLQAKATYLLSGEVMERDDCTAVLRSLSRAELGTHLHGEMVEPFRSEGPMAGRSLDEMQTSYGYDLEKMKMIVLTDLFKERFGRAPVSFRAGRFGAGKDTARILLELGYKVDSSVTPGVDWDLLEGRADHMDAPTQPYYSDPSDLTMPGKSALLEVPVTIRSNFMRRSLHLSSSSPMGRKWNRFADRAFPAIWFRPSYHSERQMIAVGQRALRENRDKDQVVLNMMFHSMEVMPGTSPYAQTEQECHDLLSRINYVLTWAKDEGFQFVTLNELLQHIKMK